MPALAVKPKLASGQKTSFDAIRVIEVARLVADLPQERSAANDELTSRQSVYAYVSDNPLRYIDPYGLWSITVGGYAGAGGEITFGNDSGNRFITARVGFGFGGGASYDPNGGIPGQEPNDRCNPGSVLSVSGKAGAGAGPFGTSLEGGVARNYSNQESGFYREKGVEATSDKPSKGLHASASFGGQFTAYSGKKCGCQ